MIRALFIAALGLLFSAIALGQTDASEVGGEEDEVRVGELVYSPYVKRDRPTLVLFSDTHLHTSYSTDAVHQECAYTSPISYTIVLTSCRKR